jgi:hypothetical protein
MPIIAKSILKKILNPEPKVPEGRVQSFDSEPTDDQLADFVDFEAMPISLKTTETAESITAKPTGFSVRFIVLAFVVVCVVILGLIVIGIIAGGLFSGKVLLYLIVHLFCLGSIIVFMGLMNYQRKRIGEYFIFNKTTRTLKLPRYKIELSQEQIRSFFQLYSYRRHYPGSKGGGWGCELSVLAHIRGNKISRFPVVISEAPKKIEQIGRQMSESFGAPLRTLKMDKKTGKAMGINTRRNT